MSKKYKPISCHFYDELELLAVRQKACPIIYNDEAGNVLKRVDTIIDFKIINKAEFMFLKSGERIRLDRIVSVDNKQLVGYC